MSAAVQVEAETANAVGTKRCTKCGEVKTLENFERMPECRDGRRGQCRRCIGARRKPRRLRLYAARPLDERQASVRAQYRKNRERRIETARAWRAANPEKVADANRRYSASNRVRYAAKKAVEKAILAGTLTRATSCARCGAVDVVIDGHHPSYAADQWLVVEWICRSCHRRHHAAERAAVSA